MNQLIGALAPSPGGIGQRHHSNIKLLDERHFKLKAPGLLDDLNPGDRGGGTTNNQEAHRPLTGEEPQGGDQLLEIGSGRGTADPTHGEGFIVEMPRASLSRLHSLSIDHGRKQGNVAVVVSGVGGELTATSGDGDGRLHHPINLVVEERPKPTEARLAIFQVKSIVEVINKGNSEQSALQESGQKREKLAMDDGKIISTREDQ